MSAPYKININGQLKTQFVLDQNKCVACQACVIACKLENETSQLWRQVYTFNARQLEYLPLFHLSLACNHCDDAPCMQNCPALAYQRDLLTGAILHLEDKCIGCQYCTWACPYSAPKYNASKGIVEKCNFCIDRLHQNLKPACVTACPTGALDISQSESAIQYHEATAFHDFGIKPNIQLLSLSDGRQKPQEPIAPLEYIKLNNNTDNKHISFKKEWPLAIFTAIAPLLSGIWVGVLKFPEFINKWIFAIFLLSATILSTMHLGKKSRAYRAILNIQNSWLSREIGFWGVFVTISMFYLFVHQQIHVGLLGIIFGFLSLYAIDKVYSLTIHPSVLPLHSSSAALSGLMYFGFASGFFGFAYLIIGIKILLFGYRFIELKYYKTTEQKILSLSRILLLSAGLLVQWQEIIPILVLTLVFVSELIDRALFYEESDTMHPSKMIANAENNYLNKVISRK
jgi:Fe-S-cluster-containing dehydrogenase component/DMSO reductase anchor subunit